MTPRRTVTVHLFRLERTPRRTHLWRLGPPWHWLGSCEQPTASAAWEHLRAAYPSRADAERALIQTHRAPLGLLTAPDVPVRVRAEPSADQLELLGTPLAPTDPDAP